MHKKIILIIWLIFASFCLGIYYFFPEKFTLTKILAGDFYHALLIYTILGCLRGFSLIPVSALLWAGMFIFPPVELFTATMFGIAISSFAIYHSSSYFGFDKYFLQKYPHKIKKLKKSLKGREVIVSLIWSFLPIVPTDAIVYAGSSIKIPLPKILLGVLFGEGIIVAIYIYLAQMGIKIIS